MPAKGTKGNNLKSVYLTGIEGNNFVKLFEFFSKNNRDMKQDYFCLIHT
jgi:hypothetical protein